MDAANLRGNIFQLYMGLTLFAKINTINLFYGLYSLNKIFHSS